MLSESRAANSRVAVAERAREAAVSAARSAVSEATAAAATASISSTGADKPGGPGVNPHWLAEAHALTQEQLKRDTESSARWARQDLVVASGVFPPLLAAPSSPNRGMKEEEEERKKNGSGHHDALSLWVLAQAQQRIYLRQPVVIMVIGAPGTGKTTTAQLLASELEPDDEHNFARGGGGGGGGGGGVPGDA